MAQGGKLIVFSAPSGTGKSTIIARLMAEYPVFGLQFSISATSRLPRGEEQHGREYYFFSPEEFRQHIDAGDFLEWEEVYPDKYYGTLRAEIDTRLAGGQNVVLDIDYVGGLNVKRLYGERVLSIFILPPSLEALRQRLQGRGTDAPELIEQRLAKAELELASADAFDVQVVNDDLEQCLAEVVAQLRAFLA